MNYRLLGQTGLKVSPIAFGGNVFGWTVDEAKSIDLLDAWLDAGFNFIDTADSYSTWAPGNKGGESETIIGNWIKKRNNRSRVIIATKVGSQMAPGKKGLSKKYILEEVEESLMRLQTDYIDLYQSHWPDPETPYEETLEAYDLLLKQGKIRACGCSNLSKEQLLAALNTADAHMLLRYQTLQPLYNLYERSGFENGLQQLCEENQLGVITYYSLASGFLTGKYRSEEDLSKSARGKGIKKYLDERGFRILKALDEISERYNTTPASVSIAWLLTRLAVTAPIASATSVEQVNALTEAVSLKMDEDAIHLLDKASSEE
jgi:aryl-alcohol dehydrogenase-like predicted oxidoreductase